MIRPISSQRKQIDCATPIPSKSCGSCTEPSETQPSPLLATVTNKSDTPLQIKSSVAVTSVGVFNLLKHQNEISTLHRPAVCHRFGLGSTVIQRLGEDGWASIDGLMYCGSSSCWFCSRKHAEEKRREWVDMLSKADALNMSMATLTLTIRTTYRGGMSANSRALDVLYAAFAKLSAARWRRKRGWQEYLRALEIVLDMRGKAHGHFNVVLLCDRDTDLELLESQIQHRWRELVIRESPSHAPSLERGAVLRPIETAESIQRVSRYSTKLGALDSASRECLQGFNKSGKGLSPEQLLLRSYAGDRQAESVFRHWQSLVEGRRRYATSKSLAARLDDQLRADGLEPSELEEPVKLPESVDICSVRARTRGLLWRLGQWQAILAKLNSMKCPDLDRALRIIVDCHGAEMISDDEFQLNLGHWLLRRKVSAIVAADASSSAEVL